MKYTLILLFISLWVEASANFFPFGFHPLGDEKLPDEWRRAAHSVRPAIAALEVIGEKGEIKKKAGAFFLGPNRLLATAYHNVRDVFPKYLVRFRSLDGDRHGWLTPADIVYWSPEEDLVLFSQPRIDGPYLRRYEAKVVPGTRLMLVARPLGVTKELVSLGYETPFEPELAIPLEAPLLPGKPKTPLEEAPRRERVGTVALYPGISGYPVIAVGERGEILGAVGPAIQVPAFSRDRFSPRDSLNGWDSPFALRHRINKEVVDTLSQANPSAALAWDPPLVEEGFLLQTVSVPAITRNTEALLARLRVMEYQAGEMARTLRNASSPAVRGLAMAALIRWNRELLLAMQRHVALVPIHLPVRPMAELKAHLSRVDRLPEALGNEMTGFEGAVKEAARELRVRTRAEISKLQTLTDPGRLGRALDCGANGFRLLFEIPTGYAPLR